MYFTLRINRRFVSQFAISRAVSQFAVLHTCLAPSRRRKAKTNSSIEHWFGILAKLIPDEQH
jgi:hypothetical protein